MFVDSLTVLAGGFFIKAILAALFFVFWMNDRRAVWFNWWAAAFLCGSAAALAFIQRGHWPDFAAIALGNTALVLAFGFMWQGARVFHHRPPLWLPVLLVAGGWLLSCLAPAFMEDVAVRVVMSSAMVGTFLSLTVWEFWRGRSEALPSRLPVLVVLTSLAVIFWIRIPLVHVLPFPFGALPLHPGWLGVFNLVLFLHTMVLTVLFVALSKERLEFEQRRNAQTDALTGALNRRAFDQRVTRLAQRHERNGAPLCLMIVDLDRFKALNDQHGHGGGDQALVRVVALIQDSIRPMDMLFRMGGDEFCCVLPGADLTSALQIAERVRARIDAARIVHVEDDLGLTVSIGVASASASGYETDALVRDADSGVYEAKRQGRNRVAAAEQSAVSRAEAPVRLQVVTS